MNTNKDDIKNDFGQKLVMFVISICEKVYMVVLVCGVFFSPFFLSASS